MKSKILPTPHRYSLTPAALGFYDWRHQDQEGEAIYTRTFTTQNELADYIGDRYGKRFAAKVMQSVAIVDNTQTAARYGQIVY
jgi:hypothetical protein